MNEETPDFSTPAGKMFILLWTMRQEREFLAHRAIIQAIVAKDNTKAVQSAFEDLANAFNPYLENFREEEKKKLRKLLDREASRGALAVRPSGPAFGKGNTNTLEQKFRSEFKGTYKNSDHQLIRRRRK